MTNRKSAIGVFGCVVGALVITAMAAAPVAAQATVSHTDTFFDITGDTFDVPCVPETVTITEGSVHFVTQTVETEPGVFVTRFQNQPAGVTGVGSVTGDTYHFVGITTEQRTSTAGIEDTFISNFDLIGPGPGNNATVHTTTHFTVDANGDLTAEVANFQADCK